MEGSMCPKEATVRTQFARRDFPGAGAALAGVAAAGPLLAQQPTETAAARVKGPPVWPDMDHAELWNYPAIALALEAALLFGGMIMYLRVTIPINAIGRVGLPVLGVVMVAIQSYIFFGPPPASPAAAAMTALVSYVVFAALAEWLARQRRHAAA
jgi:hypothetical protein